MILYYYYAAFFFVLPFSFFFYFFFILLDYPYNFLLSSFFLIFFYCDVLLVVLLCCGVINNTMYVYLYLVPNIIYQIKFNTYSESVIDNCICTILSPINEVCSPATTPQQQQQTTDDNNNRLFIIHCHYYHTFNRPAQTSSTTSGIDTGGRFPAHMYTGDSTMAKEWKTFGECLRDHAIFLGQLPYIMYAYVSMFDAKTVESIMLTVNSVNRCSYCTGLHGELARLSGLSDKNLEDTPAVCFSRNFAKTDGKDIPKLLKDAKVKDGDQSRVVALSYFLYWGSYGGNTINSFVFCKSPSLFGLVFTMYYGILYIVILLTTGLLKVIPGPVPAIVSSVLGVVLTICAGSFIYPSNRCCWENGCVIKFGLNVHDNYLRLDILLLVIYSHIKDWLLKLTVLLTEKKRKFLF